MSDVVVKDIVGKWMQYQKRYCKKSSMDCYRKIWRNYLSPAFGEKSLADLSRRGIELWMQKERKTHSLNTCRLILSELRSILRYAEQRYSISIDINRLHLAGKKDRRKGAISRQNHDRIMTAAMVDNSSTATAILLALLLGMRLGEICALQSGDVDMEQRRINIRHTVSRVSQKAKEKIVASRRMVFKTKLIVTKAKTETSIRQIPLPDILYSRLKSICHDCKPDDYILSMRKDQPLDPRTLEYRYKNWLMAQDVPYVNFHQLRHSCATMIYENTSDINAVKELLGHANISTSLDYYVHTSEDHLRHIIDDIGSHSNDVAEAERL